MKMRRGWDLEAVELAALRCASSAVPRALRAEWLAEWRSELWYVRRTDAEAVASGRTGRRGLKFCCGAFYDAFWLRWHGPAGAATRLWRMGSAGECAGFLALIALLSGMVAIMLPGAREALRRSTINVANGLVMISRQGHLGATVPSISVDEYEAWTRRRQKVFAEFAYYRQEKERVQIAPSRTAMLSVAVASENLFRLLHVEVPHTLQLEPERRPALVLSDEAWRRWFAGDLGVLGKTITVGGRQVVVAAVLGKVASPLLERMDAWLLEDERTLRKEPPEELGFVLGQMTRGREIRGRWQLYVSNGDGNDGFDCVPLAERTQQPLTIFLFALVLACLALPATTPLPLGEYPTLDESLRWSAMCRRWTFLLAKAGFILPALYCASLGLAYTSVSLSPASAEYVQFFTSFAGCLFCFRWTLRDQRRRCPSCLQLLTNPAQVGEPSRNFLAWYGTEFMCDRGHGLLHVPEVSTSWFSTQRWLYLDPSWRELFSR